MSSERPLLDFGRLLDEAWKLKRSLGQGVSNNEIDEIYATALRSGAVGGKLLGAGGGGFLLVFAAPENHAVLKVKLNNLLEIPFRFERSGSQVIFFDRQIDYSNKEQDRQSPDATPLFRGDPAGQGLTRLTAFRSRLNIDNRRKLSKMPACP